MSGFKLADGSDSGLYEIGDTFVLVTKEEGWREGDICSLYRNDLSSCPLFKSVKGSCDYDHCDGYNGAYLGWDSLKPTAETKAKRCDFTKADLKDGMRCTDREGDDWYVCGDFMACKPNGEDTDEEAIEPLGSWDDDLTDREVVCCDIIRVTDRDGTVLFERKPEKKKVMLELTDEQLEQIKREYGL